MKNRLLKFEKFTITSPPQNGELVYSYDGMFGIVLPDPPKVNEWVSVRFKSAYYFHMSQRYIFITLIHYNDIRRVIFL
jgi:hypothetical protein